LTRCTKHKSPNSVSDITIENNIHLNYKRKNKKTNTCPKQRRPTEEGECPPNMFLAENPHGDKCCYKIKKEKQTTKCPKIRLPINGNCPENYYLKQNKYGEPCCYKKTKKML